MRSVIIDKSTNTVRGVDVKADHDSYIIEVPKSFHLEKKIKRLVEGKPYTLKRDGEGNILYKDEIKIVNGEEVYKEVHYNMGMKPIRYEVRPVTEKVTKIVRGKPVVLEYSKEVEFPVEFETLQPIVIDNEEEVTISILDSPEYFNLNEVMVEKYRDYLLTEPLYDNIVGDYFFNEQDIDMESSDNMSLGFGAINLDMEGRVNTRALKLSKKSRRFKFLELIATDVNKLDIFLNGVRVTNAVVILPEETDRMILTFGNRAEYTNIIESYVIGY